MNHGINNFSKVARYLNISISVDINNLLLLDILYCTSIASIITQVNKIREAIFFSKNLKEEFNYFQMLLKLIFLQENSKYFLIHLFIYLVISTCNSYYFTSYSSRIAADAILKKK